MLQQTISRTRDYQLLQRIGANIALYRKQLGLSQEKMAEKADISRAHLARIEQGMGAASLPLLFSISDVLDIPLKALFDFPEES